MTDVQELSHVNDEDTLVVDVQSFKKGLLEGMKGVFTPYKSLYEAITGKEQTFVTRGQKTGRFTSKTRERARTRARRKMRGAGG